MAVTQPCLGPEWPAAVEWAGAGLNRTLLGGVHNQRPAEILGPPAMSRSQPNPLREEGLLQNSPRV
jgi:hypothetical protein